MREEFSAGRRSFGKNGKFPTVFIYRKFSSLGRSAKISFGGGFFADAILACQVSSIGSARIPRKIEVTQQLFTGVFCQMEECTSRYTHRGARVSAYHMKSSGVIHLWDAIQQKEDYPIFRLTYLSKSFKPFTHADLDDIENKSVGANNARDVTGLLIIHEDRVLKIIEGREDIVREL